MSHNLEAVSNRAVMLEIGTTLEELILNSLSLIFGAELSTSILYL
jgi:hypothetical protein